MRIQIGILTTFYEFKKSYSLTSVVENQLRSLVRYGYKPVLFVHDNFKDDEQVPEGVEIRKVIPRFHLIDYQVGDVLHEDFNKQVQVIKSALEEHLQDIDIALTHDWIFQGWFLIYNVAMRKAEPNLKCKWLHWMHSAPSPRPRELVVPHDCRFKMMPKSKMIYMNKQDALRLAEMYAGELDDVRVIYNPTDPRTFWDCHPATKQIIEEYKLLDADIVDVYPISMTRAVAGKGLDKLIWLMGKIKKNGKSVKLVVCNAHANGKSEKDMVERLLDYAERCGLTRKEVIFTSLLENPNPNEHYLFKCLYCEYTYGEERNGLGTFKYGEDDFICDNPKCKKEVKFKELRKVDRSPNPKFLYEVNGVPRQVVRELFQLSDIFVFPTMSENCPLILLEAALSKNLLVLNKSFSPLSDFVGGEALYFDFGALGGEVMYDDEEKYYDEVAKIIIGELNKNKPLNAFKILKQKFNTDYIFKNQLEPVLWEMYNAKI